VRLPKRFAISAVGVLALATVALPAIASSETSPTIEAYDVGVYSHYWSPASATVAPGGVVKFANPYSDVNHGLEFTSASKPSCTGIPAAAGEKTGAPEWHGECTFSAPGTYTFICTVHPSEMKGTITVAANGTTTTTTTVGSYETSGPGSNPATPTGLGPQSPTGARPSAGALLAGDSSTALRLASTQHGRSVHGSVAVSQAASGGKLEVRLLATRASLARTGHRRTVQVGRASLFPLHAGTNTFTVALDATARHALHLHRHLALTVTIAISSASGAALTLTRQVVVHG
jgi:plastocyanin